MSDCVNVCVCVCVRICVWNMCSALSPAEPIKRKVVAAFPSVCGDLGSSGTGLGPSGQTGKVQG